jgi:hypothetical protein
MSHYLPIDCELHLNCASAPAKVESASSQGQVTQMINANLQLDLKYTLYAGTAG